MFKKAKSAIFLHEVKKPVDDCIYGFNKFCIDIMFPLLE